ncbi:MAG: ROK family protein [Clostridia bacterium]|nr:ROK family protein [Clostridia bacterium]
MKIGIDLGGSHIAIGVVNENGVIVEKLEKRLTSVEKKDIKKSIEEYIIENVNDFIKKYKIEGMWIAIPGTVDDKKIIKSVNLGLENYEIAEILKSNISLPITIRNDAKCAAIAENKIGSLKNYDRSIFLTLGTGIGGAVIINDKLLETGELPGCEFGHMTIEKNGVLCNCGKRGCWEKYASMKSFKNNLREKLGLDETTRGQELFNMIRDNKEENQNFKIIENTVNQYIEYLSLGIANLINIFEPEAIGIGGSFVYFEEVLLDRLKNKLLEENMLFNSRKVINVQTAILGNEAGIIGATL